MALRVEVSCLAFLISLLVSFAAMANSQECQYVVRVKTGDRRSAGTDSMISLKLMGSNGNSFAVNNLEGWGIMGPGHEYFERGNLDVFNGKATCVNVCAITVISNGAGYKPGWYLDYVEITVSGGVSKNLKFPVNQWLALDEKPHHLYADVNLCPRFGGLEPILSFV
ncbi:hypothetical protein K1719_022776 [Acacia pycnantha]|nr:hypothetical protein K1719_022776 [Acacia pycnantha]